MEIMTAIMSSKTLDLNVILEIIVLLTLSPFFTACSILSAESIETMFALPKTIDPNEYKPGERYYACGWNVRNYGNGRRNTWHTGSLTGTYKFMARWRNGVNCVVLFNKRRDGFSEIDPLLSKTAKSVTDWPEHDLFNEMLN